MSPVKKHVKTTLMIIASALISALSLKVFISAGGLFPGGFSGLAVLLSRLIFRETGIDIPFGLLYVSFNILPTILVYKYVGKWFTRYSVLQYALVSILVAVIPEMEITYDIVLIAIFGGILSGISASLALAANASGGGTDFIAIYISNKTNAPAWQYILYGNSGLLVVAGLLFGWEKALYSIIYQYVSTQVVNSMHQRYKLMSLRLFTEKPDEMIDAILKTTRHGITKLWGEGGYSKQPKCMLYMVVNAFEVEDIVAVAQMVDPKVFIDISKTERVLGNYYRKPLE